MTASKAPTAIAIVTCLTLISLGSEAFAQFGSSTPASRYFTGRGEIQMPAQSRQRPTPTPQPSKISNGQKPFQNIHRPSTITPYLSLDIVVSDDDGQALPNYYAFYRPQREQQQNVESQQAEIRRLQQQVRVAGANNALSRNAVPGIPTTGTSSQFMNLGNYYPGLR